MIKTNMEIEVDNGNVTSNIDRVIDFIVEQSEDVSAPEAHELVVAAQELVLNIYQHAYEPGNEGTISVECLCDPKKHVFQMAIRDSGKPFNPVEWGGDTNMRIITCGMDSKGLGILIAKRFLPNMEYKRENGQNVLKVTKRY